MPCRCRIANDRELPEHLQVGTRITHHGRGPGTVVLLREQFPPTIFVEYDAGDVHGYKGKSWHKLKPMSRHDSVVLVAMVQNGDHKVARKMYNEGQLERGWLTQTDALGWTALHWLVCESRYDAQASCLPPPHSHPAACDAYPTHPATPPVLRLLRRHRLVHPPPRPPLPFCGA